MMDVSVMAMLERVWTLVKNSFRFTKGGGLLSSRMLKVLRVRCFVNICGLCGKRNTFVDREEDTLSQR